MALGLLSSQQPRDLEEAARAFEALALKQILVASGAFRAGGGAGSQLHTDLFVDALAAELAKAGGIGLAATLVRHLESGGATDALSPVEGGVPPTLRRASDLDLLALVEGRARLTSGFGRRIDPIEGTPRHHHGVDLGAPEGTPILAAGDGIVRFAGERGGYGNAVEIDHGNGVTTLYAHASELLVEEGSRVSRGQPIAKVGASGRATGNHLHFEVRFEDRPVHPARALKEYGIGVDEPLGSNRLGGAR